MTDQSSTFITRVILKNYKSIAACDVELGPLMFLVGPNGSGKSNFLDALRLVSDALNAPLDHAIRARGGINEVRRRSSGHPRDLGVRLEFRLRDLSTGHFAFRIGALPNSGYKIVDEECVIYSPDMPGLPFQAINASYRARDGRIIVDDEDIGPAPHDRLYLPIAPKEEFWVLSRMLAAIGFYNLDPAQIRDYQNADPGLVLTRDGSNIASVLREVNKSEPDIAERISEYVAQITPGFRGVAIRTVGNREGLEFRQIVAGAKDPWRFPASNMSDGTLRALGILVALFQSWEHESHDWSIGVPLVAIEEPEAALHPAGAGVLFDALRESSVGRQVLVTSHSPDLLDNKDVDTDSILAVISEAGETQIGPIEDVSRSVLRDRLYTVGELLRMDQLRPATTSGKTSQRVRLFSDGAA